MREDGNVLTFQNLPNNYDKLIQDEVDDLSVAEDVKIQRVELSLTKELKIKSNKKICSERAKHRFDVSKTDLKLINLS